MKLVIALSLCSCIDFQIEQKVYLTHLTSFAAAFREWESERKMISGSYATKAEVDQILPELYSRVKLHSFNKVYYSSDDKSFCFSAEIGRPFGDEFIIVIRPRWDGSLINKGDPASACAL